MLNYGLGGKLFSSLTAQDNSRCVTEGVTQKKRDQEEMSVQVQINTCVITSVNLSTVCVNPLVLRRLLQLKRRQMRPLRSLSLGKAGDTTISFLFMISVISRTNYRDSKDIYYIYCLFPIGE